MRNKQLFIMICIAALLSFNAGCAIFSSGSSDDASQTSASSDDISSDSSDNPFSVPADDTSVVDDDSSDDATVVVDDTDISDDDAVSVDEISIEGNVEVSVETGGGFSKLFTASPAEAGLSYTWEVADKPDWVIKAEDGSYNQRLTLSADAVPEDAAGQDFEMTITAKEEASGKEASFVFTVKVAPVFYEPVHVAPDPCSDPEPMKINVKSIGNYTDFSESYGTIQTISHEVPIVIEIEHGKAPFNVMASGSVENGRHCRKAYTGSHPSAGEPYAYVEGTIHTESNYRFTSEECEDDEIVDVTVNNTWFAGPPNYSIGEEPPANLFVVRGRLVYDGPLPVKKMTTEDGRDDLNQMPVENVVIEVIDSCIPHRGTSVEIPIKINYGKDIDPTDTSHDDDSVDTLAGMKGMVVAGGDSSQIEVRIWVEDPSGHYNDGDAITAFVQDSQSWYGSPSWGEVGGFHDDVKITELKYGKVSASGLGCSDPVSPGSSNCDKVNIEEIALRSKHWEITIHSDVEFSGGSAWPEKGFGFVYHGNEYDQILRPNINGWGFHRRELPDYD